MEGEMTREINGSYDRWQLQIVVGDRTSLTPREALPNLPAVGCDDGFSHCERIVCPCVHLSCSSAAAPRMYADSRLPGVHALVELSPLDLV